MSKVVKIIGSIVCSLLMYSVPIVTTIASMEHWDAFIRYILILASVGQLGCLMVLVYCHTEVDDG